MFISNTKPYKNKNKYETKPNMMTILFAQVKYASRTCKQKKFILWNTHTHKIYYVKLHMPYIYIYVYIQYMYSSKLWIIQANKYKKENKNYICLAQASKRVKISIRKLNKNALRDISYILFYFSSFWCTHSIEFAFISCFTKRKRVRAPWGHFQRTPCNLTK